MRLALLAICVLLAGCSTYETKTGTVQAVVMKKELIPEYTAVEYHPVIGGNGGLAPVYRHRPETYVVDFEYKGVKFTVRRSGDKAMSLYDSAQVGKPMQIVVDLIFNTSKGGALYDVRFIDVAQKNDVP